VEKKKEEGEGALVMQGKEGPSQNSSYVVPSFMSEGGEGELFRSNWKKILRGGFMTETGPLLQEGLLQTVRKRAGGSSYEAVKKNLPVFVPPPGQGGIFSVE